MTTTSAASIHTRLLNRARQRGEDFNLVLTRFALERFLYRLSQLPERNAFLLKGALLFELWFDTPHRPTRDADLLGLGDWDTHRLDRLLQAACAVETTDGITFDPATTRIAEIRAASRYQGLRVRLVGTLGNARITVQLDIGFGDAVTPGPVEASLPSLLPDFPPVQIRTYPRATVIAEKLEIIVSFGMANTRLKDYFDLYVLAAENILEPTGIASAIAATFRRRATQLPPTIPLGLTREYSTESERSAQWEAFLNKNGLAAPSLAKVVEKLNTYLDEPLRIARKILNDQEYP